MCGRNRKRCLSREWHFAALELFRLFRHGQRCGCLRRYRCVGNIWRIRCDHSDPSNCGRLHRGNRHLVSNESALIGRFELRLYVGLNRGRYSPFRNLGEFARLFCWLGHLRNRLALIDRFELRLYFGLNRGRYSPFRNLGEFARLCCWLGHLRNGLALIDRFELRLLRRLSDGCLSGRW